MSRFERHFTLFAAKLKTLTDKIEARIAEKTITHTHIQTYTEELRVLDRNVDSVVKDWIEAASTEEEQSSILVRQIKFSDNIVDLRSKLADESHELDQEIYERDRKERAERHSQKANEVSVSSVKTPSFQVRLPEINLPEFSGQLENWHPFWDTFKVLIHERQDIPNVTKLSYLKSQLKNHPLELISGLSVTAESYEQAVDLLQKTYADTKLAKEQLVRKLLALRKPAPKVEELQRFRAELENILRSLENCGCNIDDADWILSVHVKDKLPASVLEQIQLKTGEDYPTLAEIRKYLATVISHISSQQTHATPLVVETKTSTNTYSKRDSHSKEKFYAAVQSGTVEKPQSLYNCIFCNDKHRSSTCLKYSTRQARQEQLKRLGRCFRCCRRHTLQEGCNLQTCYVCGQGKHHTFLCDKFMSGHKSSATAQHPLSSNKSSNTANHTTSAVANTSVTTNSDRKTTVASIVNKNESTVLPIALVGLLNRKTRVVSSHKALLDTGSQRTFLRRSLAERLNLQPTSKVQLKVEGFLGKCETRTYDQINITLKVGRSFIRVKALITDRMPQQVTVFGLGEATKHLNQKVRLNNREQVGDQIDDLDILVGMDNYFKVVKGQSKVDGVNLIHTPGGLVIAGKLPERYIPKNISQNVVLVARVEMTPSQEEETLTSIQERVERMWKLESLGIFPQEIRTPEETWVEEQFAQTVQYCGGQYFVGLPWRPNHEPLYSNIRQSYTRTKSMYHKLRTDSKQLNTYHEVVNKQIEEDFVEKVADQVPTDFGTENTNIVHYLPHFCVTKDSSTTPLRVVYDCSAKGSNGVSLNDCLYSGPSLTEKLYTVLMKFRADAYAYMADISKAFLRVGLIERDRDFTRFFIPFEPGIFDPPQVYRFTSVLFGSTSSPYLLQAVLQHHLGRVHLHSRQSQKLLASLYVDNLQGSSETEEQLLEIYHSAQDLFSQAGMPLQQWRSNAPKLQDQVAKDHPENSNVPDIQNVLGINWNVSTDEISLKPVMYTEVKTKRHLLSNCSKIYDPLGILSPLTIQPKILMQTTWKKQILWDEELPEDLISQWKECLEQLQGMEHITFPRQVINSNVSCELHVFCDASPKAYGACLYVSTPERTPELLTAKAKVAPLQERTLPQLELTAILLGIRLVNHIKRILQHFHILNTTVWTDSQIAISWVLNNRSDNVYVRNRVKDIRQEFPKLNLRYVSTEENPADYLTKPRTAKLIQKSALWKNGPEWLSYVSSDTTSTVVTHSTAVATPIPIMDYQKYNKLSTLLRVTALVFTAIKKMKPTINLPQPLDYWVQYAQKKHFGPEYTYLSRGPTAVATSTLGLIKDLNLEFDSVKKQIVVVGRLQNAQLPKQILLPRREHLTTLIIKTFHEENQHCGTNQTLAHLREEFWLLQGRQQVRSYIKTCYLCKRLTGSHYQVPPVPPLPEERVKNCRPFTIVGIDYAGPITLHNASELKKVYIALFTCATSRAIHLELAEDLSADTLVNLFRKFIARRSCPEIVITDNATNFRAGAEIINSILSQAETEEFLKSKQISWRHIPPRAPWMGGFYERLVGVVKGSLRKCLFKRKVSKEELATVLTEIEAQVNNRPLTYLSDSVDDPQPLTPNHLLRGSQITTIPIRRHLDDDYVPEEGHQYLNQVYHRLSDTLAHWQRIWSTDYLNSLKERKLKKGEKQSGFIQHIKVGDICLLAEPSKTRERWHLCKVIQLYPDKQGYVRVVRVKTSLGELVRSVKHLYPLESSGDDTSTNIHNDLPLLGELDLYGDANMRPQPHFEAPAYSIKKGNGFPLNTPGEIIQTEPSVSLQNTDLRDSDVIQRQFDSTDEDVGPSRNVNSSLIGPNALDERKTPRRAATKCKEWLREVCSQELGDDDV